MSQEVDPLEGLYDEDQSSSQAGNIAEADPLQEYYDEPKSQRYRDPISEELREAGYEPDFGEELDRASEYGRAESTRGLISGATLGFSEHVPGLKPKGGIDSITGEVIGSFAPITALAKVFNNPLTKLASKSPVLQNQLSSLANLTGSFLSGGTYGAVTESNKKQNLPSTDDFIEHGALWALLDGALQAGGAATRFTKALFSKAEKVKKQPWKVVNETIDQMRKDGVDFTNQERVQAKALSILEEQAEVAATKSLDEKGFEKGVKDLKDRKVEQKFFDRIEEKTPEPYFPKQFQALDEIVSIENEAIKESLESLSPRAQTEKQLGEDVKANIEKGMKEAEDIYRPAYELAEEAASTKSSHPYRTVEVASNILHSLESLKTKPEGYNQVIKTLENAISDAGFIINRDQHGAIGHILSENPIPTNRLMELGRRINKIIKYDSIDKQVHDRLKPVVNAIKQDIRTSLKGDKDALEMFESAEREFGQAANKFGKESLRKIRKMDAGEKIAKLIRNPSTLSELKEVMDEGQFKQVERELLEHINNLSEERARAFYREIRPHLNTDAQAVGEQILESKIPPSSPSRRQALRDKIKETLFNDLTRSSLTGEKPEAALKLWKTQEGQQIIKDALKDNPNKKQILDYLTNQSLKDLSASIINPEGHVNFKKLSEFLKDPATLENIRLVSGEEGVNFFRNLETISKRAERNLSVLEGRIDKGSAKDRKELQKVLEEKGKDRFSQTKQKKVDEGKDSLLYKLDDFFSSYGIKTKGLLALLGISKFGIPSVIEATAAYELFTQLMKNKKMQEALKKAAGPRTDPAYLINTYEMLNKSTEKDSQD